MIGNCLVQLLTGRASACPARCYWRCSAESTPPTKQNNNLNTPNAPTNLNSGNRVWEQVAELFVLEIKLQRVVSELALVVFGSLYTAKSGAFLQLRTNKST